VLAGHLLQQNILPFIISLHSLLVPPLLFVWRAELDRRWWLCADLSLISLTCFGGRFGGIFLAVTSCSPNVAESG